MTKKEKNTETKLMVERNPKNNKNSIVTTIESNPLVTNSGGVSFSTKTIDLSDAEIISSSLDKRFESFKREISELTNYLKSINETLINYLNKECEKKELIQLSLTELKTLKEILNDGIFSQRYPNGDMTYIEKCNNLLLKVNAEINNRINSY